MLGQQLEGMDVEYACVSMCVEDLEDGINVKDIETSGRAAGESMRQFVEVRVWTNGVVVVRSI